MKRVFNKMKRLFVGSLMILTAFAVPANAAFTNADPGQFKDPPFGPSDGNVMSLKGETGEKGDSGNPFLGGEFTGDVTFNENATLTAKKKVGIGAAVSETGSVFGVSLTAGKGVRIGNWGLDGGSALFVTPATISQEVTVIRGLANQTADIFRAETGDGSKQFVFKSSGNVGIGTRNPGERLTVAGGDIFLQHTDPAKGFKIQLRTDGEFGQGGSPDLNIRNARTNSNVFMIDENTGNIGLGERVNPSFKLDVNGQANATQLCIGGDCKSSWAAVSSTPTLQQVSDQGTVTNRVLQVAGLNGGHTTTRFIFSGNTQQDNGPFIEMWGKDNTQDPNRKGELTLGSQGSGKIQFFNTPGTGQWNPLMSIQSNGNVGIGTGFNAVGSKLHVVNTNAQPMAYFEGKDLRTDPGNPDPSSYVFLKDQDAPNVWGLRVGNIGDFGIHQGGTADRITVLNNGNVGIGAANPQSKLEVNGAVLSRGAITVNEGWTPVPQSLFINSNQIWKGDTPGDDDPNLYLQYSRNGGGVVIGGASGATNALNVQGWAKVRDRLGVGRDANDLQLEVANAIEIETEDQDNILRFHDPNDRWVSMGLDRSDGNKFKINEGGSVGTVNHFVMDGSGNVGIGKDVNAAYRLDVAGKTNATELCLGGDCKSSWSQVAPAAQQPIAGAVDGTIDWPNDISGISGSDIADKQITWDEVKNKPSTFPGSSVDWSAITNKPTNIATTDTTVPKAGGTFTGNVNVNGSMTVGQQLNVVLFRPQLTTIVENSNNRVQISGSNNVSFCFLTSVFIQEAQSYGSQSGCRVEKDPDGFWYVTSFGQSRGTSSCAAQCVK